MPFADAVAERFRFVGACAGSFLSAAGVV